MTAMVGRCTLPSGDESTVAYNGDGEKTSSTDAAGKTTTYAYDADGELTSTTDPLDRVTAASYTADGQVHTVTLPDSSTETSTYNADGQLTDFENADGAHTTYSYDDAGLLTSKTEPGSETTSYTYDTAGLLHMTTNPDSTTVTDSYDAGGLLTGVAYSASSSADVSYGYDADNLRTSMTDATGTSSYSYDSRGLMTSETNGAGATIGYGYDAASQLASITYPGNNTVTYGYDDSGQMTSLTDWNANETDFTWTDDGQLATQSDPNGVTQTRSYDADDRTTGISTTEGETTLADYTYGYDNAGELTSDSTVDPNNATALTHTYSYDSDSQLTTVDDGITSPAYANTPGGEITTNMAGSTLAYNSAEELTSVSPGAGPSTSYTYDGNGDRTSSTVAATETTAASTTSYTYDPVGDLASVGIPATGSSDAETVDYSSDGDGLRQSRTVGSVTTQFTWDTDGSLPLLLDDGTNSYLYGPSSAPVAQVDDSTGTIRYLTGDLVGSTRLVTSSSGTVVGVNVYDEYGNLTSHTGTASSPFGFSGNWTDPDTGLIYLRARDYDPATAQFLTVDPLVDSTRQPYAYVADDPLGRTDPSGCDWLNDVLNTVAVGLMHGPGADVASVLEGIGDGATFGLTGLARQAMGTDCEVQKNGFYFGGLIFGGVASGVATAGLGGVGDAADAAEATEDVGSDLATASETASGSAPMGDFTESGATISHGPTATAIGDDDNTLVNLARSKGAGGAHDVIVHGDEEGNFIVNGQITNPNQIATAVLGNPNYSGQAINLVTCYGARGAADELQTILGVSVRSLANKVDLDPLTGVLRDLGGIG
jgi:RHS repeat-associated protein